MPAWVETVAKGVMESDKKANRGQASTAPDGSGLGGLTGFRESGARPVKRHKGEHSREKDEDEYGAGLKRGYRDEKEKKDVYGLVLNRRRDPKKGDEEEYGAGLRRDGLQ